MFCVCCLCKHFVSECCHGSSCQGAWIVFVGGKQQTWGTLLCLPCVFFYHRYGATFFGNKNLFLIPQQ